jgi:hypothetical protein
MGAPFGNKNGERDGQWDKYPYEYNSYNMMKQRCYNPNATEYEYYGGKGIKIEDYLLHSFENFLNYIGPKPGLEYTLERINNDGDYKRGNIKWATKLEQRHNQSNVKLTQKDVDLMRELFRLKIHSRLQLSKIFKIHYSHAVNIINRTNWR